MPFINNVKPPKELILPFSIDEFSGGLNNVVAPANLKQNKSPDMLNVMCHNVGTVESRPGLFKFALSQLPETIHRIMRYQTDMFDYLLCSSKTKLYRISVNSDEYSEVCTLNDVASGVQRGNLFYFVDGQKYREYDGTNVYEIIAPKIESYKLVSGTVTTMKLPDAANTVDDYYNGWSVYISSGLGYGLKSTITDYVGSTRTATIAWASAPDATSVIYMTNTPQGIVTINEAAKTKVYSPTSAEFSDAFQGGNNIDMANDCKLIVMHHDRIWFTLHNTNRNIVFSTDLDNMYYVPVNAYTPAITNNGDAINSLRSFNDVLVIGKSRTMFALYGWTPTDYDLKEITVTVGAYNNDVIQQIGNYLFYFGTDGHVYAMYDVRTDIKKMMSKNISAEDIDIRKAPFSINVETIQKALSIFSNNYFILAIDDKILTYHALTGHFGMWDNINPTALYDLNNKLLITNEDRYIYSMPINRYYVTEMFTASIDGTNVFTIRKGYLNEASDIAVKQNDILIDKSKYDRVTLTSISVQDCAIGDIIVITYLTLPCYNDDGKAYVQKYHTRDLYFNYPVKVKKIRTMYLQAHTFKNFTSNIDFNAWIDYQEYETGIKIVNKIALWGKALWGDIITNKNVVDSQPIVLNNRGRMYRFIIENNEIDQPFRIYRISGEVNVRT